MKSVGWYLTSKESTFTGAYNMRAPQVTPSPQMQKEGENQIHYSTPTCKYGHNDSYAAKIIKKPLQTNKLKARGNEGTGDFDGVPHDRRHGYRKQQAASTSAAQGTTDGGNVKSEH